MRRDRPIDVAPSRGGPRTARRNGAGLGAAALLWAAAVAAQPGEESRGHGIFVDSIEVRLINVEVRVTRGGEPVTDLAVDEFEILDDGEPVEITHFYRVEDGRRMALAATGVSDLPTPTPAAVERSTILVLVDQRFLSLSSRKLVFDRLREHLAELMREGAWVMVANKNREVLIEQPLTTSPEEVGAALDRLAKGATPGWSAEIRQTIEEMEGRPQAVASRQGPPGQALGSTGGPPATSQIDAQAALQQARRLSVQLHQEVGDSLTLLRRFVGSLAGVPGRKAILYVADALPVRAGEPVWRAWWANYGLEQGARVGVPSVESVLADYDSSDAYRQLVADANASRVAFYPIGVDSGPRMSGAESRGLSVRARAGGGLTATEDARRWLAAGTAGEAALGRGSFEHLFARLRQDTSHYYSLAFASRHRGDGQTHELTVRVSRPDLEVRHPGEYRDKSPEQRMTERSLAALLFGAGENPLGVRVEVGKARREGEQKDLYRLPVEIGIPVANLVLLPDEQSHHGRLSIQLVVRDEEGRLSEPVTARVPIEIPHAAMLAALSDSAAYPAELLLRRGSQTIAVSVLDELGATGSTVQVQVDVGGRG